MNVEHIAVKAVLVETETQLAETLERVELLEASIGRLVSDRDKVGATMLALIEERDALARRIREIEARCNSGVIARHLPDRHWTVQDLQLVEKALGVIREAL